MKALIKKVPIPTAGVALGLAALGLLLQPYSEAIHFCAGLLSLILIISLGAKIVLFPHMVKNDLKDSILASVSATIFMTIMQLTTYLAPIAYEVAFIIWVAAIGAHFALMVWFTGAFIFRFKLTEVFPTYFIAYVGIIVASATSATFGMQEVGFAIFWFGFVLYAVLLVVVSYRYAKHEIPEGAKPLFCIFAAPMSLSLVGYLTTATEPNTIMIGVMTVLAQLFLLLVLSQIPKLLRIKFYPSYAAMTFPFVITATALNKTLAYFEQLGYGASFLMTLLHAIAIAETVLATAMVLYVLAHYLRFFFRRLETKPSDESLTPKTLANFLTKFGK